MSITRLPVVTYVKVELLNIDGSVIGHARIRPGERVMREALGQTVGVGYDKTVELPVSEIGDPRCPYQIRVVMEA